MTYKESLPDACPPEEAQPLAPAVVIRLLKKASPDENDFKSYAALGKKIPISPKSGKAPPDPCSWASCSTYLASATPLAQAKALGLLPMFKRFSHAAFVNVDPSAGKARLNPETRHVDYWFFSQFEPLLAVHDVEPIR